MALAQSDLMQLQSLCAANGVETIRVLCERILQELIEAEATGSIGAAAAAYARSLALLTEARREMRGFDPAAAGTAVAQLQEDLAAIDGSAQSNPDTGGR